MLTFKGLRLDDTEFATDLDEAPTTVTLVTGSGYSVNDEGNATGGCIDNWYNNFTSKEVDSEGNPLEANRMTKAQTGMIDYYENTTGFNKMNVPETVTDGTSTYTVTKIGCWGISELGWKIEEDLMYKELVLPKSIVDIESYAFYYTDVQKVDLSQCTSLQTIGRCAFARNSKLSAVDFSGCTALQTMGNFAFAYNESLETVDLSGCTSLKSTGVETFAYDTKLKTVDFSGCTALQTIDHQAFRNCEALTSVDLSANKQLTTLENGAFAYCTSLTKAILPPSVTTTNAALFAYCSSLKEVYITSKLTDKANSKSNFYDTPADCAIYLPLQHMDYYRSSVYAGTDNVNIAKFYPILEAGKMYRTFSFDKALNFNEIKGLYDEAKTLKANYVSAVDLDNRRVTFKAATGDLAAYEGFIIEGTGVDGEFYPVKKAATTPEALGDTENYLEGNGENPLSFEDKKPVDNKQRYFIMKGGDFYYCTGGTLAPWKCNLDLRTPVSIYDNSVSGETKPFTFIYEEDAVTPQPVVDGLQEVKASDQETRVYYTLDGVRLSGQPTQKGIYICNGRKVVVR